MRTWYLCFPIARRGEDDNTIKKNFSKSILFYSTNIRKQFSAQFRGPWLKYNLVSANENHKNLSTPLKIGIYLPIRHFIVIFLKLYISGGKGAQKWYYFSKNSSFLPIFIYHTYLIVLLLEGNYSNPGYFLYLYLCQFVLFVSIFPSAPLIYM